MSPLGSGAGRLSVALSAAVAELVTVRLPGAVPGSGPVRHPRPRMRLPGPVPGSGPARPPSAENGRVTATSAPRCPACGVPVPPGHHGRGRQPVYCGTDRCKQARARRAAERREAVALLRLVAQMASYAATEVGNGLTPADARAAVGELAGELATAAVRLRRIARPGPAQRRALVGAMSAQGMSGAQVAARVGLSEKTVYRYRARTARPQRSPERS
jgi:hypothetical protein